MENLINTEMEKQFLGACMLDPCIFEESTLSVEDFGTVDHQCIYKAIAIVYEEKKIVDPLLVADILKKQNEINRVGGAGYIYELQAVITETESAKFYVDEIKNLSLKRKYIAELEKAKTEMKQLDTDPQAVMSKVFEFTEKLQPNSQSLEYITHAELENIEFPEVKWLIPDFLPSGLTVLAGPAKIGKSLLCLNMAIAICTGGVAFSNRETLRIPQQRNVTYIELENGKALVKDRLRKLSPDTITPLMIIDKSDMGETVFDAAGLKRIEKHVRETRTELLIVDTWQHVAPDTEVKGTSYNMDYKALIPVQKFALDMNIAIIIVTHTRKAADLDNPFNQIQGSSGMQAGCDTMMMLSHDSGSKTLHMIGRRIPSEQYAFTIDENGLWILQGEAQEYYGSELNAAIIEHLEDAADYGLSIRDIIDLTGEKDNTVRSSVFRLLKNDQIIQKRKRGRYFAKTLIDQDSEISP